MLKWYPKLLHDIYLSEEYYGENVLHMGCVAEDASLVKWLLDEGSDIHRSKHFSIFVAWTHELKVTGNSKIKKIFSARTTKVWVPPPQTLVVHIFFIKFFPFPRSGPTIKKTFFMCVFPRLNIHSNTGYNSHEHLLRPKTLTHTSNARISSTQVFSD